MLGKKNEKKEDVPVVEVVDEVGENMLVNQGEEEFGEGQKARKTVKATKESMKA